MTVKIIKNKTMDKWLNFCGAWGQAHLGFLIFLRTGMTGYDEKKITQHERIHLAQARELLILFWYILYVGHYLVNLIRYLEHREAYRNIIFEREAYENDRDQDYLLSRKRFAWRNC